MELSLNQNFYELTIDESLELEGGSDVTNFIIGVAGFAVGAAVGFAVGGPIGAAVGGKNGGAIGSLVGSVVGFGATAVTEYVISEMVKSDN